MTTVSTNTHIDESPRRVFDSFVNLDEAAGAIGDITAFERLTPGQTGHGTRFRETRVFLRRSMTEEMEIVDFHPDADVPTYTVRGESCSTTFDTVFRFHPEGEGTRVEAVLTTIPKTLFARVISPIGWMLSGHVRKCIEKDIADLKRVIERGTLVGAGTQRVKDGQQPQRKELYSYARGD